MFIGRSSGKARSRENTALRTFRRRSAPMDLRNARHLPPGYVDLAQSGFGDWRLQVDGLVMRPTSFSLDDIRALPARTQITRHDCVEGWSCIGSWTGAPLSTILDTVGLRPEARFIIFHCADELPRYVRGDSPFYESIDLIDAFHPQTILAYEMNGVPLLLAHGAPLRLRVERQLGYKMAKFLRRVEVLERFASDAATAELGKTMVMNGCRDLVFCKEGKLRYCSSHASSQWPMRSPK